MSQAIPYCDTPLKFVGSSDAVRPHSFDAMVANISAATNLELWPQYNQIVKPQGVIILSGFEDFTLPATPVDRLERDGWLCYVFTGS